MIVPPAEQLLAENKDLKNEVALLRLEVAALRGKLFGGGQGEQLERNQLTLPLEGSVAAAPVPVKRPVAAHERAERVTPRVPLSEAFASLPVRETIVIEPAEVQANPEAFERIGEERTFEVDITPPQLFKREFIRPKYRRIGDRSAPPLVALAPKRLRASGYASSGLVAHVILAKYLDHAPLFRQEKMFGRWGARISRQTMCEWIEQAAFFLKPIRERMLEELLKSGYLQVDETSIRCNDPDHPECGSRQGWLWAVSNPEGDVVFEWHMSRRHSIATELLEGFSGLLQTDGYEAYPAFANGREEVAWLACWAHARRKFHEALSTAPTQAMFILRLIGSLYLNERRYTEERIGWSQVRANRRGADNGLTLKLLRKAAECIHEKSLPRSNMAKACAYLLSHWEALMRTHQWGQARLDTNLVENSIRPTALGKKNWMFIGHPDAGERSAILYSLIISCQRRGIDPAAYLRDVLTRLPAMTNQDDIGALTPDRWSPGA